MLHATAALKHWSRKAGREPRPGNKAENGGGRQGISESGSLAASPQAINRVTYQRCYDEEEDCEPHAELRLRSLLLGFPVVHGLRKAVALEASLLLWVLSGHHWYPLPRHRRPGMRLYWGSGFGGSIIGGLTWNGTPKPGVSGRCALRFYAEG
jgi:hypothetical protein